MSQTVDQWYDMDADLQDPDVRAAYCWPPVDPPHPPEPVWVLDLPF
jgi:hypothetical protein